MSKKIALQSQSDIQWLTGADVVAQGQPGFAGLYNLCIGHQTYLPVGSFSPRKLGRLASECRPCYNSRKGLGLTIPQHYNQQEEELVKKYRITFLLTAEIVVEEQTR